MAVIFNPKTGFAEDLPDAEANAALQSGTHHVLLNDPDGNPATVPLDESRNLLSQGFSLPAPEQLQSALKQAKYSTPLETTKAALEKAASSGTFGLSTGVERALGVNPEGIRGREEQIEENHPFLSSAASLGGLGASAFIPGLGEANVLRAAGTGVAKKLGAEGLAGVATRLATEGALFQAGNELSKTFEQDPHQTIQSAITNTGLSALLTPAIGIPLEGASSLWNATVGKKLAPIMQAAKDRLGIGTTVSPGVSPEVMNRYPEVKAMLGDNPTAEEMHQHLLNSPSKAGSEYRNKIQDFKKEAVDEALNTMGYDPENLPTEISNHEAGKQIQESLVKNLEAEYEPFAKGFKQIEEQYSDVRLGRENKNDISKKLQLLKETEGYGLSPSSAPTKEIDRVLSEIENANTVEDLRKYSTIVGNNTSSPELWRVGKQIKNILNETTESLITDSLGAKEGAGALANHLETKGRYGELKGLIDDVNDRLRAKNHYGPGTFINALKEMAPEDVLSRLSDKNDVGLTNLLNRRFPEVANTLKQIQLDKLVKSSIVKGEFNLNSFVKKMESDSLPKEYKEFLLGDKYGQIKDVHEIVNDLPTTDNPSGSGKAIARNMGNLPWHLGAGALLAHGNPILAGLAELTGGFFSRELPDAARVGWLRFLGSGDSPVNPEAMKAVIETASKAARGMRAIQKAVDMIVPGTGSIAVPEFTDKKKEKLEKAADEFRSNPTAFLDVGKELGTYEPNHAAAMGTTIAKALQIIATAKPVTQGALPLDADVQSSRMDKSNYERTLKAVENPLHTLNHLHEGTLIPQDIQIMSQVYPELYQAIKEKLTSQVVDVKAKDMTIPYQTKIMLSLFMGQPLDSTMTPQAIASNQPQPQMPPPQPGGNKGSKKSLSDMPGLFQSKESAREANRRS